MVPANELPIVAPIMPPTMVPIPAPVIAPLNPPTQRPMVEATFGPNSGKKLFPDAISVN